MATIAFFDIPADHIEPAKHFTTPYSGGRSTLAGPPEQAAIAAMQQQHAVLTG